MRVNRKLKVGDVFFNPFACDVWVLRKGYYENEEKESWILCLVHDDYEEKYEYVKNFIKVGNVYDMTKDFLNKQ